jgi:hypothetical protein
MDRFTETALARSRGTSFAEAAVTVEEEKGPTTIEERLLFAYPDGVPKAVARMIISWELPYQRDSYQTHNAAMAIYRELETRALAANRRGDENRARIPELERSLATLRAEYAGLRSQLERPPALHLTPREAGLMEVDRAGYEKLIPAMETEIERLRSDLGQAMREHKALWPLARLAGMIAGHLNRGAVSASDFGFEYDWQICAPSLRKEREAAHREELERKRIAALQWEAGRAERERHAAELEEAEALRQAEEARFQALGIEALISHLFFEGEELTLAEVKARVAGWDELRTFKEVIRLWPGVDDPDLLIAAQRDVSDWIKRRRDHPAWRPTAEEDLINRTARRLAEFFRPGHLGAAAAFNHAAQGQHETQEPTCGKIDRMDFDSLMGFIFSGKSKTLDDLPTFKSVIEALPARPAANTLQAASNELLALGVTESFAYNHALRRLSSLVDARLNPPWEGD